MRATLSLLMVLTLGVLVVPTWAQEDRDRARSDALRRMMVVQFDTDGDGQLSDGEWSAARRAMQNRARRSIRRAAPIASRNHGKSEHGQTKSKSASKPAAAKKVTAKQPMANTASRSRTPGAVTVLVGPA